MTAEIGGYFEWEMAQGHPPLHDGASLVLKSARSCLAALLERERPTRVRVPYYICDAALEPFRASSTEVEFFALSRELEIDGGPPRLADGERLLYVNYFGLKSDYVRRLEREYKERLWVDEVQAFFAAPVETPAFHFNSARKFFGVPDGAYLYVPAIARARYEDVSYPAHTRYDLDHLALRLEDRTREGLAVFRRNEELCGGETAAVSEVGRAMLGRIDYRNAARRRRRNYAAVQTALGDTNGLPRGLVELGSESVPMSYPYLPRRPLNRSYFWDRGIFVPTLWSECRTRVADGYGWEKTLSAALLPLPVDQRYDEGDMANVVEAAREHPATNADRR